ncbi:MAG TPA: carbonic anhydrase [bacterium]|jgi:carbonic anhydrase|nr:carbonic anhydrase [bacterium]
MRKTLSVLGLAGLMALGVSAFADGSSAGVAPDAAWHMLVLGNNRFVDGLGLGPHQDAALRRALSARQHPWAVVVSDSDSRVTPEFIFDLGLGDLYVVRDAGSILKSDVEVASVEYGVERLGARLVVVLGHSGSGVVKDAVEQRGKSDSAAGRLAADVAPAVDEARDQIGGLSGEALESAAVEKNVLLEMKRLLKSSPAIADDVKAGDVKVIGGVYDLETGHVHWLGEHPSQEDILDGKKP